MAKTLSTSGITSNFTLLAFRQFGASGTWNINKQIRSVKVRIGKWKSTRVLLTIRHPSSSFATNSSSDSNIRHCLFTDSDAVVSQMFYSQTERNFFPQSDSKLKFFISIEVLTKSRWKTFGFRSNRYNLNWPFECQGDLQQLFINNRDNELFPPFG